MPFWKQSEDPWDQKPDKPRREPKEPQVNPLDSLKAWNEERKVRAKEKEEAKRLPPEKCPWCGKDMEQGYMIGQRGTTQWYPGLLTPKNARRAAWSASVNLDGLAILDEGNFVAYKTVWLCRNCKKMVFDMPEDAFSTTETDTDDELREEDS